MTKNIIIQNLVIFILGFSVISIEAKTINIKVTTLNTEWLSCHDNGPSDEELQMNNIAQIIRLTQPDIIALQEVGTSSTYATIDTLVERLGDDWGGNILPTSNNNCGQNQGVIYNRNKIQFVGSQLLNNGISSQDGTYYYNWSSGRYPVVYNVNIINGNEPIPLTLVNIHAKAYNDETSYSRRKGGAEGLKAILDGNSFNNKNIIITGDFNDYLTGSQCYNCGDSPYKNFMDDTENYMGLTSGLFNPYYNNPVIDNIVISNELFGNYVSNSAILETSATNAILNYKYTTSDHTPISALLNFQIENPYPEDCKNVIFSETFSSNLGDFTSYNVTGYQDWYWREIYGAYISGFANSINNENEDWLISPALDLSNMQSANLSFEHALNFSPNHTDKITNHTLLISNDYEYGNYPNTARWTKIDIPTMPSGNNWTYVQSGNIDISKGFLKDNMTFAFRYISDSSTAGTWEIKNLNLTAICGISATSTNKTSNNRVYTSDANINIIVRNNSTIQIFDILGNCIIKSNINDNISIPINKSGIYIVKISNEVFKVRIL